MLQGVDSHRFLAPSVLVKRFCSGCAHVTTHKEKLEIELTGSGSEINLFYMGANWRPDKNSQWRDGKLWLPKIFT